MSAMLAELSVSECDGGRMSGSRIAWLVLAAGALQWAAPPVRAELVDAQGNAPGIAAAAPVFEDVGFITGNATTATAFPSPRRAPTR